MDAQALGWPAIASGRHTLIAAPTGSGKTLTAFLTSLNMLVKQALGESGDWIPAFANDGEGSGKDEAGLPDATQVVGWCSC